VEESKGTDGVEESKGTDGVDGCWATNEGVEENVDADGLEGTPGPTGGPLAARNEGACLAGYAFVCGCACPWERAGAGRQP
jgi:hypothetical protein